MGSPLVKTCQDVKYTGEVTRCGRVGSEYVCYERSVERDVTQCSIGIDETTARANLKKIIEGYCTKSNLANCTYTTKGKIYRENISFGDFLFDRGPGIDRPVVGRLW